MSQVEKLKKSNLTKFLNKTKLCIKKVESDDDDELVQDGDEESDHLEVDSNYGDQPESDETPEDFVKRQEEFQNCLDSVNQVDVENGQAWHQRATFTCYQCQTNVS